MLGSFKNWFIIKLSHKATTSEDFEEINQVVLNVISENMTSLDKSSKYGATNTTDITTMGYYLIRFVSETYNLQDDTTCDRQISAAGEIFFNT